MNYLQCKAYCIGFIFFNIFLSTIKPHSFSKRFKVAEHIISIPSTKRNLHEISFLFSQENRLVCSWFADHNHKFQNFLNNRMSQSSIAVMGSRRWQTSHILSDIDAVLITQDTSTNVIELLECYYKERYPNLEYSVGKTLAGLNYFTMKNFSDPGVGEIKLEYTIQTPSINSQIILEIERRQNIKFKNSLDRALYAVNMMEAVYSHNNEAQAELKKWLRVLPGNI